MTRLLILLLLASPVWGAYSRCRIITVPQQNSTLTDFMVHFSGTYSYLATVANGGELTDASGYDVDFFSDAACTTSIPWERAAHNLTTGAVRFNIRQTLSGSASTVLYIGTGDASVTTDQSEGASAYPSDYKGVWHLEQDPSGSAPQMLDATSNDHDLTSAGTMTSGDLVAGKIGNGLDFDGANDVVSIDDNATLSITGSITVSCWFKMANNPGTQSEGLVSKYRNETAFANQRSYELAITTSGYVFGAVSRTGAFGEGTVSNAATGSVDVANGAWRYASLVYVPSTSLKLYIDGAEAASNTTSIQASIYDGTAPFSIGLHQNSENADYYAQATIDEVRVSTTARSADWLLAEYNNQNSPATFYTITDEAGAARRRVFVIGE